MRSIYKCPIPSRCNERKNGGIEEANQKKEWCDVKREEWNLYILKRGVSLGAEYLKKRQRTCKLQYPYQKNRMSYISWLTYYTKCRKIHKQKQQRKKEITNTKHPNQLNTGTKKRQLGGKKKKRKTLTHAPKVKNNRAFPEEKNYFS